MTRALLLCLSLCVAPALAFEPTLAPVSSVGPGVSQARGAAKKLKRATDAPVMQGKARVVVLSSGRHDEDSLAVRRKVAALLPRFELSFLSDVDLSQEGLLKPGGGTRPEDQPGSVPASTINVIRNAVDDIAMVGPEDMTEANWRAYAEDLQVLAAQVWFVDRADLRAPLFNLYYQIGRAAENGGFQNEPFYRMVDGNRVNYYYFLAAALADGDASLMNASFDAEQRRAVQNHLSYIEAGRIDRAQIPLDLGGRWDADAFFSTYKIFVNGLEVDPEALPAKVRATLRRDGVLEVAPGIIDLQLRRKDGGPGMAERFEVLKPDDGMPPARDEAWRAVSQALVKSLSADSGGCSASPPRGTAGSLALFAKQFKEPVYVAMAVDDNPSNTQVWQLDKDSLMLQKVLDTAGRFPVRLAALFGSGMTINGATLREPTVGSSGRVGRPDVRLGIGYVPVFAHLRGHYKHFMASVGMELGVPIGSTFEDRYQTKPDLVVVREGGGDEVLKSPRFNRMFFVTGNYVHGPRAAEGMGIRVGGRLGWYDVPHTVDLSIVGGITAPGPSKKGGQGRVNSVFDLGAFVGMMVPFGQSVFEKPLANFGVVGSAGTTF